MEIIKMRLKSVLSTCVTVVFPWFKDMTRVMIKTYFVITLLFLLLQFVFKKSIPLLEVAFIGVVWGYTIAITYWLVRTDAIPVERARMLHFAIILAVNTLFALLSGMPLGTTFFILSMDYPFLVYVQDYLARRSDAVNFNSNFSTLKKRWEKTHWEDEGVDRYEHNEGTRLF